MTTIYKDDEIMIKTTDTGSIFYTNGIRVDLTSEIITKEKAEQIAPALKITFNRIYTVAYAKGYNDGVTAGKLDLKKQLKDIFDL